MTKILDGKSFSNNIIENLKKNISKHNLNPRLDILLIGDDKPSHLYVKMKKRAGEKIGIKVVVHKFSELVLKKEVLNCITDLNNNKEVDGIIVQLPLPIGFNKTEICNSISFKKDVDGLTSYNLGKIWHNQKSLISATPLAVIKCLKRINIDIKGKLVLIVNDSFIIGKPLAALLNREKASIILANKYTKNLFNITKIADVIISGTGQPNLISKENIKNGSILIDVGINQINGKIAGDINKNVIGKASYLTPVPGGIGPMTVACLLENAVNVCLEKEKN